jgi:hypothetical protein
MRSRTDFVVEEGHRLICLKERNNPTLFHRRTVCEKIDRKHSSEDSKIFASDLRFLILVFVCFAVTPLKLPVRHI